MEAPLSHHVFGQQLWLSAQRAIYWEAHKALIVSDLHFGKTGHFRKAGIAVPQSVYKEDLQRLVTLLHAFRAEQLIVVGDFFHSSANMELDLFRRWRHDFASLEVRLVRGNHDILHRDWYETSAIEVIEGDLRIDNLRFIHEPCDALEGYYTFCGHIHPGIMLHGLGKQSLRLPCFYFGAAQCILPAFSKFTGLALVAPGKETAVFAIADNKLVAMS